MSLVSRELLTLPEPIDALSLNNSSFGTYFDFIYYIDLEIKYTADVSRSVSYIDIKLENLPKSSGGQMFYLTLEFGWSKRLSDLGARLVKGFT
jgi:hypothetical protein